MNTPAVAKHPHENGDDLADPKHVKSREKFSKRAKTQRRRALNHDEDKDTESSARDLKAPRLRKRMCALLIGYCGSGYRGLRFQYDGTSTIESTLFSALVRAGAISEDNADDPDKVNFARASRTDAGVHAAGNLISLKMITQVPGVPDVTGRINEELPPGIRLWEYIRVQNSFNPRTLCDSRKYTYFFPSYLLLPPKPTSELYRVLTEHAASLSLPSPIAAHPFWAAAGAGEGADSPTTAPSEEGVHCTDIQRKRTWRVGTAQMEQLRTAAQRYLNTHNFHNFTLNGVFTERSYERNMKDIVIADPVVYGQTEWISVMFHGQSFMMHQRKMISALVLACRTGTPPQLLEELYGPDAVIIPKMPALGLLLEQPIFDSYNTKLEGANAKLLAPTHTHTDFRPPIDFSVHREEMETFKARYIYENMRMVEERDGLFDAWIRMVDAYAGTDLLYLNPKGTIPPAAVMKNNDRNSWSREGAFVEAKRFNATSFPLPGQVEGVAGGQEEVSEEGEGG
ncbi:pseudouridine synthase [Mycena alexandri]|uniref:tRNA pseudouridine synthase 1 n=1 Tax=Mycena alexandri TaxID=1745969 RepID=A0AAD6S6H7_9AGAR|nr:pseudouridine synthase [Mycena alexandri]